MKISKEDWQAARYRYETEPGITLEALANDLGCTRQNVGKRASREGWGKVAPRLVELAQQWDIAKPTAGSALGIRTPENIAQAVTIYARTGNKKIAAHSIGISPDTLARWAEEEPELAVSMRAERNQFLAGQYDKLARGPWQAAVKLLETAPETRSDFVGEQKQGPTIILNIQRD